MTKKEVINALENAIKESGKIITQIPQEAIVDFIKRRLVNYKPSDINEVYKEVSKRMTTKDDVKGVPGTTHSTVTILKEKAVVPTTKQKTPRKTIFSEIKKIT